MERQKITDRDAENISRREHFTLENTFPCGNFWGIQWLGLCFLTVKNLGSIPGWETWGTTIPQAMRYSHETQSYFLQQESDFKNER